MPLRKKSICQHVREVDIHIAQRQNDFRLSETSIRDLVEAFLTHAKCSYDEVSIHFVDAPEICDLHGQFFDDPSLTDCISFPMDDSSEEGYRVMGEIFVCPETARQYVADHGGDIYKEMTLYVIHGLLHLIGYDDIEEEDERKMRAAEQEYLADIGTKNLWLLPLDP